MSNHLATRVNKLEKQTFVTNPPVMVEGMTIAKTSLVKILQDIDGATAGLPPDDGIVQKK